MLAANSGFDFRGFADFVMLIAQRRLESVQQQQQQQKQQEHKQQEHKQQGEQQEEQQLQQQQQWRDSELQSLQLAFHLTRAAHVLQQIQQAVAAAAAYNAAWCERQLSKRWDAGSAAAAAAAETVEGVSCLSVSRPGVVGSTSAFAAEPVGEHSQLPEWVFDLNKMIKEAQAAVSRLLK
jgi:septal ring factor EnvC (AmiA/AmiB activator)